MRASLLAGVGVAVAGFDWVFVSGLSERRTGWEARS